MEELKKKLQDEIVALEHEFRSELPKEILRARELGDLSENAEYHAAKEQQSLNEGRAGELEGLLGRAEIIDVSKLSGKKIVFGATVTLEDDETEEKKVYQIVGDQEADVKAGRISISSPISRALIGKSEGDAIEVNAPGGARGYEILSVRFV